MTPPRCIVVLGGDAAEDRDRTLRDAAARLDAVTVVADAAEASRRIADASERPGVTLAVIGPAVVRPLSVARELRRADSRVGLAFVVGSDRSDAMELRLGLVPELRGASVLLANGSVGALAEELRAAIGAEQRRQDVRGALDAMNRQLLSGRERPDGGADRQSVSQSYLAALVAHVPEAILSVDRDGCLVAVNDAALATLGIEPGIAEGSALADVLDPDANAGLHAVVDAALRGETTTGHELELVAADGRSLLGSVTAAAVGDHADRLVGAVLLVRDITTERRTQQRLQELQKAQSLATLAGGVAHDFNNLLVGVKGWAQLAADDLGDTDLVRRALDRIEVAADRAAELARAMLVYSGRGQFEPETADLNELTRQVAELLHGTISRKTDLRLEFDDELPTLEADTTQLRQVIMNLLTNAAEALGDDQGAITVRTAVRTTLDPELRGQVVPADRYVVLEVADTGPGLDDATRRRVFEPFFTTKFEGRGLGLAASDGIVRAHGGGITVTSRPGAGATFRMVLPIPGDGRS